MKQLSFLSIFWFPVAPENYSYPLMPFVASQEENRLFINFIIDSFTKHILRT